MEFVNNSLYNLQKSSESNENGPLQMKIPPFNHKTFAYSLIGFIFFYCFIWNIEDKTNLAKASTLFTYANSGINTLCWLLFYFTTNSNYLIYGISSLFISLIAELFYGTLHYPEHMYFLTAYIHHTLFIILINITFWTDILQYNALVILVEFPVFLLHHKRRYSDNSPWLNYLFGISFLLLRIFYWIWLYFFHPILSKIQFLKNTAFVILCIYIYWFGVWIKKTM